jgi:Lon protease-like protein
MNEHDAPAEFDGTARLFPLPGLVFFPHVMQPLHIFEPRYRQMTADALASDKLIALVLPRPGWEPDYAGRPAIHQIATLGQIVAEQKLEDGRYNLLLRGLHRIRIVEEIPGAKLYRQARAEIVDDVPPVNLALELNWRHRLRQRVPTWINQPPGEVQQQLHKLLEGDLPLGALCDILSFALPLDPDRKQELLAELDVDARLTLLFKHFDQVAVAPRPKFPPDFSEN